jgi:hypothetical protein
LALWRQPIVRRTLFYMAYWFTWPLAWRQQRTLKHPERAQRRVLKRLVRALRKTDYGRALGVRNLADFHEKVPIVDYADLAPWIEKQKAGQSALLTRPPSFYERTSGSTGAQKDIPYSRGLLKSFGLMFVLWARDLYGAIEGIGRGRIYFSISPQVGSEPAESGLKDDRDYLPAPVRWLLGDRFLRVPGARTAQTTPEFLNATSLALLAAKDLQVISVWSPSFLTVILDHIQTHRQALVQQLDPDRASQVRAALNAPEPWRGIWPGLCLISVWEDGQAAPLAKALRVRFPGVRIQGKGLLATEAPMTVPKLGLVGQIPMLTEVFFEFEHANGEVLGLHGLELNQYRTHDQVQVLGRVAATPTLRFVGRDNRTSDLVGEKLTEGFVAQVLSGCNLGDGVYVLAPRADRKAYVLFVEAPPDDVESLLAAVETGLAQAHHYALARNLGQLQALQLRVYPDLAVRLLASGSGRLGQVKPSVLLCSPLENR